MQKLIIGFLATVAVCFACRLHAAGVPDKPENAAATTNRTDGISLTWNAVEGASYYIVYRYGGQTSQTGLVQTKVVTSSCLDTSCEAGVNIPYRVRAFNSSGMGGAYSAYVRGYRKVLLEPYVGGYVSVNPLANGGIAQSLKVRCNVDWTAKASDWINLNSAAFGRSNEATELGFSLGPNTTGEMREGTITVYAGQESATLKVLQGAVSVPDYDTWCGDSALAIIEDAAFPEEFRYRTEYTGGFLSYPDETAVGGSCLRTSPLALGGRAVISWKMPSAWKLRFSWRKDTSKSADALKLYAGNFASDGTPNLSSAKLIATCSSTDWAQVEVSSQAAPGADAVFFVYDKNGTPETSSGFGFIDNFLLMTAPMGISFAPPTRYIGEAYSLNLPCDATQTVATEVTFSHTVTYGGVEHPVKGIVYPTWQAIEPNYYLDYAPGSGDDANKTVFSSREVGSPQNVMLQASYEVAGESVWEDLTVTITPPALGALDCSSSDVSIGSAMDWGWKSDGSATNGSCLFCAAPNAGYSRSFSVVFDGLNEFSGVARNLFSFNYKMQSCASDESVFCTVDGAPAISLPATGDTDWHRVSIFIPDTSRSHEVTWTYAKSGYAYSGSGVSIDFVEIEELPTSLVVNSFDQTVNVADYVVSEGSCSVSILKGDDWMSCLPGETYGGETAMQLSTSLAFDVGVNETWDARGGKLGIVAGGGTNFLYVVQSATADTMVEDLAIQPTVYDIVEGVPVSFTASFTLGGQPATDFVDLEWLHDFGDDATVEDGVLTVNQSGTVMPGSVGFRVGDSICWNTVKAHPPVSLVAPSGLVLLADGWWVEDESLSGEPGAGLFLQTDIYGERGSAKTLTATVTGPGVFRCEGRGKGAAIYIDGARRGGTSGGYDWSEGLPVEVPEGEHVLSIVYQKTQDSGYYDDISAIRNLTLTPLEFAGFVLRGASAMSSGGKETFTLLKTFRDEASGYETEFPQTIEDTGDIEFSVGDSRTRDLLTVEQFGVNEIQVTVPLAVQWEDTVTLRVKVVMDDETYWPTCLVDVTPAVLSSIVDSEIQEMSILGSSYATDAFAFSDGTAEGGSCLRLKSSNQYYPCALALKVMDAGTLAFNYRLLNPYGGAELKIYVDDVEVTNYTEHSRTWTPGAVQVEGVGPHLVRLEFTPGSYKPLESMCDLDNVQWTPGAGGSRIVGATVTGPANAGFEDMLVYSFALNGYVSSGSGSTSPANWTVKADEWNLQFVSGDPEALSSGYISETCEICVSTPVTNDSVFRLVGRYAIGGTTYEGTLDISVPARTTVAEAIFDSGTYENCRCDSSKNGWMGTFSDHSAGLSCAQCKTPDVGDYASFGLEAYGKGTLEFDWKVSCADGDELLFYKDTLKTWSADETITGTTGWRHVTITYGDDEDCDENGMPITHHCEWQFVKNSRESAGLNCGWVDNVTWSGTTLSPIRDAELVMESSLVPGQAAPVTLVFYRYDQNWNRIQASDASLPAIESVTLSDFSDLALEPFVSAGKDGRGNYSVVISPECDVAGTFAVGVKYTLYGNERYAYAWGISVEEGGRGGASMLGARSSKMMAANGINTVGECLEAGLDPDDADAKFTTYVTMTNGVPYITWSPNLPGRTYIVKGKASLADPQWVAPTNSTHRFFKVEIESDK